MTFRPPIPEWRLFIAMAGICLLFPTRVYYWDGIAFAQAIENSARLSPSLVHPNHLVYNFAGFLFYKLLRACGANVRAVAALQILNSLLSAICARVLYAILMNTLRSRYFSICLTVLFAFSATWWRFATDANAYIPSILFLLISFYLVLPRRKAKPLLTAFTFFLAMTFHQLAMFMFPVLMLGVYLQDGPPALQRRVLNVVYFSLSATVLIVMAYAGLFYLASGSFDLASFIRWTTSYAPEDHTKFHVWSNLQYSLRGLVRLFFGGRLTSLRGLWGPGIVVLVLCLIASLLSFVYNLVKNLRPVKLRLEAHQKTVLLVSLLWTAVYTVFLFCWLPQNTFYRLFYLPALILLLGLAVASVKGLRAETQTLGAFVIAVALANFLFLIYPFSHPQKYPPLAFALEMNQEWPAGTMIFYGAENSDERLIRYFNPGTRWERLGSSPPETCNGNALWLETTAIDRLDPVWLETHVLKEKVVTDPAYRIRFVQVH